MHVVDFWRRPWSTAMLIMSLINMAVIYFKKSQMERWRQIINIKIRTLVKTESDHVCVCNVVWNTKEVTTGTNRLTKHSSDAVCVCVCVGVCVCVCVCVCVSGSGMWMSVCVCVSVYSVLLTAVSWLWCGRLKVLTGPCCFMVLLGAAGAGRGNNASACLPSVPVVAGPVG